MLKAKQSLCKRLESLVTFVSVIPRRTRFIQSVLIMTMTMHPFHICCSVPLSSSRMSIRKTSYVPLHSFQPDLQNELLLEHSWFYNDIISGTAAGSCVGCFGLCKLLKSNPPASALNGLGFGHWWGGKAGACPPERLFVSYTPAYVRTKARTIVLHSPHWHPQFLWPLLKSSTVCIRLILLFTFTADH